MRFLQAPADHLCKPAREGPYPRVCVRASQAELAKYLLRLQQADMLVVVRSSEIPKGPDGSPVYAGVFTVTKDEK